MIHPRVRPFEESGSIQLRWHTRLEEIEAVEPAWRELEQAGRTRTIHGAWDYVYPWYHHLANEHRRPLLGLVWQGDTLIGAAPLVAWNGTIGRVPVRRLDFVGHQWDGGEFLIRDDDSDAAGMLIRSLRQRGGFDAICLNGLVPGSGTWDSIERAAAAVRLHLVRSDYPVAIVDLGRGFDAYHAAMGHNFRHNVRRMAKRIQAAGGFALDRIVAGTRGADVESYIRRIFLIVDRSWKVKEDGPQAVEHRHFNADVIRRFASRGALDLAILTVGGRDAAFIVALVEGATYYDFTISYDDGFRDLSPGIFLMVEVLRRLPEQGIRSVVSHGAHDYKLRWASAFVPLSRAFLFRSSPAGLLSRTARFTLPAAWERWRPRHPDRNRVPTGSAPTP